MSNRGLKGNGQMQVHSQEVNFSHDNSTAVKLMTAYTLPSKSVNVGDVFHFSAHGAISSKSSAAGTLTIAVLVGGVTVVTKTTGTLTSSLSAEGLLITGFITIRSVGDTGTAVAGFGVISNDSTVLTAANQGTAQTVNFDTESAITLSLKWSVADAANILDIEGFEVRI